ncbi:MAG: hypothetical protein RIQ93_2112 [Verrucomicrobiota bacterium]|jgi:dienelactone hydrolase
MTSRRDFLQHLASASTAAVAGLPLRGKAAPADHASANVPSADMPQSLAPTGGNLGSNYRVVEKLVAGKRYPYSFLGDRFSTLSEFKQAGRAKVLESFGYRPEPVEPRAEVVDRRDVGDHIREKVIFSTSPHFRVPAYVLIPKGLKQRAPAIVDLHSHGGLFIFGKEKVVDLGANHPVMPDYHRKNYEGRPTATELVRRGYVVIVIDAFMFGERRVLMDADLKHGWDRARYSPEDVAYLNGVCRGKETTLAKSLAGAGMAWMGIVAWDDMRTVDYLVTRPEVDPERIGCCGVSMGGYRTIYLAALDDRIKVASIVGFMSTIRSMLHAKIDTHSWVHFPPGVHGALDLTDVASLHAPLPLMVQQCRKDGLFTLEGMEQALQQIGAAYAKAGVADRFEGRMYDEPHWFSLRMQDDAFAFFDRHLKS